MEYISSDPDTVKYEDGKITGVKAGKATVSAVVTAKSDGWIMEYSTIVTVAEGTVYNSVSNIILPKVYDTYNEAAVNENSDTNTGIIKCKKTVKKGSSIKLKVKGVKGKVKWSVDDKSRAVIKKNRLKAKKAGKVVVTAKAAGITLTKTIKIKK